MSNRSGQVAMRHNMIIDETSVFFKCLYTKVNHKMGTKTYTNQQGQRGRGNIRVSLINGIFSIRMGTPSETVFISENVQTDGLHKTWRRACELLTETK